MDSTEYDDVRIHTVQLWRMLDDHRRNASNAEGSRLQPQAVVRSDSLETSIHNIGSPIP